jgi:hypothetical protein
MTTKFGSVSSHDFFSFVLKNYFILPSPPVIEIFLRHSKVSLHWSYVFPTGKVC